MNPMRPGLLRRARIVRELARTASWFLVASLAPAFAHAQDRPAVTLLASDAERLTTHADPRVRGEAALTAAASGDPRLLPAILRVASDEEPRARAAGMLALGFLGAAGAESRLVASLCKPGGKPDEVSLAAAFSLARQPAHHGADALNKRLSDATDASFKRERESLLAMLCGLLDRGGEDANVSLERLARDASLRDPHVRAALLTTLSASTRAVAEDILGSALRASSAEVRIAALAALSRRPDAAMGRLDTVTNTARTDTDAGVRAAALRCLTEARHLPALELATKASRSKDPRESAQGVATLLELGGEPARRTLVRQFTDLGADAQSRLLESASSPFPEELISACHSIACDARREAPARHAAVLALLRMGQSLALDRVLEAFAFASWPTQCAIASAARGEEMSQQLLAATSSTPAKNDSRRKSAMLAALMLSETPGASLQCARWLAPEADAETVLVAIRALRQSRLPRLSDDARAFLPELLRPILLP